MKMNQNSYLKRKGGCLNGLLIIPFPPPPLNAKSGFLFNRNKKKKCYQQKKMNTQNLVHLQLQIEKYKSRGEGVNLTVWKICNIYFSYQSAYTLHVLFFVSFLTCDIFITYNLCVVKSSIKEMKEEKKCVNTFYFSPRIFFSGFIWGFHEMMRNENFHVAVLEETNFNVIALFISLVWIMIWIGRLKVPCAVVVEGRGFTLGWFFCRISEKYKNWCERFYNFDFCLLMKLKWNLYFESFF